MEPGHIEFMRVLNHLHLFAHLLVCSHGTLIRLLTLLTHMLALNSAVLTHSLARLFIPMLMEKSFFVRDMNVLISTQVPPIMQWCMQVSESLDKFAEVARNQDGKIGVEEFAEYLGLPVSPALVEVFRLYDRTGSGEIDFREYVIGLSLVSQPANSDETLKRAFKLFDVRDEGFITFAQGKHILESAFEMSEEEVSILFRKIDKNNSGKIYYHEFAEFVREKPEYAKLFLTYQELKEEELSGGRGVEKGMEEGEEEVNNVVFEGVNEENVETTVKDDLPQADEDKKDV